MLNTKKKVVEKVKIPRKFGWKNVTNIGVILKNMTKIESK